MGYLDPPEPDDGPCALCGHLMDDCSCPECPTCGDVGCLTHAGDSVLWLRREWLLGQLVQIETEMDFRMRDRCGQFRYLERAFGRRRAYACANHDFELGAARQPSVCGDPEWDDAIFNMA